MKQLALSAQSSHKCPAVVWVWVLIAACFGSGPTSANADENVTVSKSRLEELEQKEKELEKLKGNSNQTKVVNPEPANQPTAKPSSRPVVAPLPEPVPAYISPPLDSLPAIHPYSSVESMDLANYYHADSTSADQRFRKQKLLVRGEIVGFEKPVWKRSYRVLLKTPVHETKVICDLLPPDKSSAVFTTKHGEELVALMGETRVPIARVGQTALIKGECKGVSDSAVLIMAWDLKLEH